MSRRGRRAQHRAWLLLALLAVQAAVPHAAAQVGPPTPRPTPSPAPAPAPGEVNTTTDPLPQELRHVAFRWLDAANRTLDEYLETHPEDANSSRILGLFRAGAWSYLNASRLTLAQSQLHQIGAWVKYARLNAEVGSGNRVNATLALMDREENASSAAVGRVLARLGAMEAGLRTTWGLEYALQAMVTLLVADAMLQQVPAARAGLAGPRVADASVLAAVLVSSAPQAYATWASDLADLASQAEGDAAAPRLPAGALQTIVDAVNREMTLNPDANTLNGRLSNEAATRLEAANQTGPRLLYVGRFLDFQAARTADALSFLRSRGLSDRDFADRARLLLGNASLVVNYDGLVKAGAPGQLLPHAREAGYQGILQADALNTLRYAVAYDPSFETVAGGWKEAVQARFGTNLLLEVASPRPGSGAADPQWLLWGGIAVTAGLVVVAVVVLRRPGG